MIILLDITFSRTSEAGAILLAYEPEQYLVEFKTLQAKKLVLISLLIAISEEFPKPYTLGDIFLPTKINQNKNHARWAYV